MKDHEAGWTRTGPYEYAYPGNWTITNRFVAGKPRWALCRGTQQFGTFLLPEDAMKHHAGIDPDDNNVI